MREWIRQNEIKRLCHLEKRQMAILLSVQLCITMDMDGRKAGEEAEKYSVIVELRCLHLLDKYVLRDVPMLILVPLKLACPHCRC